MGAVGFGGIFYGTGANHLANVFGREYSRFA
jgi:hypothetical protein